LPYLEQFMQQWKAYLLNEFTAHGFVYLETEDGDFSDIKANSLIYFSWLRTAFKSVSEVNESRDAIVWIMLERQLRELAKKAEKGTFDLISKLHIEESQIQISLNFSYDDEQHIVYVS
tara:strand:+ start:270 stop:623 length:354 start_codon:yes stop_codon:yes gene_type:complete